MERNLVQTLIDETTLQAYRETIYRVVGDDGFSLRIGVRHNFLARLIAEHGFGAAFITAYNPFSIPLPEKENRGRHRALREVLVSMRLNFLEGSGQHPSGDWMAEHSALVLGVTIEQARGIGAQFGQNAIVWVESDGVPKLVLLQNASNIG